MVAFLFPGQGSQAPGMGKALRDSYSVARQAFEEADEALGFHISKLCFEGTEHDLKQTAITQPAILATSTAALRVFLAERPDLEPSVVAGHSLGEWSALVSVGALAFADALRLVRERGRLMQEAVPEGEGAMMAVLGLSPETVTEIARKVESAMDGAIVRAANFNFPEQTVISGVTRAVQAAGQAMMESGAKRVVTLVVSAPFHCPLMEPAARGLEKALAPIAIGPLSAPVVTNVEALPNSDPRRVKALLVAQVTHPVRWIEIIRTIASKNGTAIEIGPGRVLAGLARRIESGLRVLNIEDDDSLKKTLDALAKA